MWKVTNETNKILLDEFREKLINPLMKTILNYKLQGTKYSSIIKFLDSDNLIVKNNRNILKLVSSRKINKKKISYYIEKLKKKSFPYLLNQYKIYIEQTKALDAFNYNIKQELIDDNLRVIFSNYFYEKLFKDKKLWNEINKKIIKFDRKEFHKNFKEENGLSVCPYCDADTIISDGNIIIEHFMPRDRYPFLSMHPNNLISACHGCNAGDGKGTNYYLPVTSPYNCQIGNEITFDLDKSKKKVILNSNGNNEIENYIKLLKLSTKYESETIYSIISSKGDTIFRQWWNLEKKYHEKIDINLINDYLMYKKEPLTFAAKSIFKDISHYENFKKKISS